MNDNNGSKSQLRRFAMMRGMPSPQTPEEFAEVSRKLAVLEEKIEAMKARRAETERNLDDFVKGLEHGIGLP